MLLRRMIVCDVCDIIYWLFCSDMVHFLWFHWYFCIWEAWHSVIFSLLSLLNQFHVKSLSCCAFFNKFVLRFASKRDVCDMLICAPYNNRPSADHPIRLLSWSLGVTWYKETKTGEKYILVWLKNNKMASKRDLCDQKRQKVEVGYLMNTVFDNLCIRNFQLL